MTAPTHPDPVTSPRGSRAPAEILRAAEAILLEEGPDRLTVRRVARRSGYTAPTLYHHFGDKRGLLLAVLELRFRQAYDVMRAVPAGDPVRQLREMARAFIGFAFANPDHYRLLTLPVGGVPEEVPAAAAARELVKGALEVLVREGALATGDTELAFQVTWATLHGLISLQLAHPESAFSPEATELALDTIEHGLLRRSGR